MTDSSKKKVPNVHAGHRERLRNRYKKCGFDDFQEHEVLELLLFYAIPRTNTNLIAHNLLNHFGSLYAVLNASEEELIKVNGVGPASATLIHTVADTARAGKLKEIASTPLTSWDKLYLYATEWFCGRLPGTVAVILLDKRKRVITVRTLAEEHLRRPSSYPETILNLCQQLEAGSVILAHNHTDGIMRPSEEDLYLTKIIYESLNENGIELLEHLIVHNLDAVPILDEAVGHPVTGYPRTEPPLPYSTLLLENP